MNLDFHSPAARGLRRYMRLVSAVLDPVVEYTTVQWRHPVNAYVSLSSRLHLFPTREVGLRWDEKDGWAMVLATCAAESQTVLRYLGHDRLPEPEAVGVFAIRVFHDEFAGQTGPPTASGTARELATRLANYATTTGRHRRPPHSVHLYGVITSRPSRG